ncbi:MAG TPA: 3-hydroxyacyl-CoA dehydrogenase [Casimicrobiaceae bacterium]|nr:3-hydroxyacyl-CoA dehydrogenase [Casimicrobiaceae bacterium]
MQSSRNDVIGVVGAGLMGRGIAQITAQAGFEVRLIDVKADAAAQAKRAVAEMLASLAAKGKITADAAEAAAGRILLPSAPGELAGCSIVIEAIVERLDAKQALFASLESIVGDACILATNTSSLSVTAIASACLRPERVAGLHFFSPVPLMRIAEAIGGLKTAPEIVTRLVEFVGALGHTPVRAKDTPGFIVNHAGRGYGTEALRIAGEGIADYATIDRILKFSAGFRMGPFELFDLTGLDVSHPAMESIYRQFYEEPRFRPSPLTGQRLAAGVLGRKSGRGFYDYTGEAPAPPEATAPRYDPPRSVWISRERPDVREGVVSRILEQGCRVDPGATAAADSLCLVLPLGRDATTSALDEGLDPRRTVALDTFFGFAKHWTLMTTPLTEPRHREAARALFESGGSTVDVIHDSPGFVAQRVLAHIVNVACDIAQQRIATPPDIDLAVKLGLAYPRGPLEWGDTLGPSRVLQILQELHRAYGDPRYRPSIWLSRRARLGVSLLVPDG